MSDDEQKSKPALLYPCSLPRWAELPATEQVKGISTDAAEVLGWPKDLHHSEVTANAMWRFEEGIGADVVATTCSTVVRDHGRYLFVVLWTPPRNNDIDLPVGEWVTWVGLQHLIGTFFIATGWMPVYRASSESPTVRHEKPLPAVPPPDTPNTNGDRETQQ